MSHTPGPWCVDVTRRHKRAPATMLMVVAEAGGMPGLIVNMGANVTDDDWANARLIAAAPDLLAALKEIVRGDMPHGTYSGSQCVEIAQAAIAKAEGK